MADERDAVDAMGQVIASVGQSIKQVVDVMIGCIENDQRKSATACMLVLRQFCGENVMENQEAFAAAIHASWAAYSASGPQHEESQHQVAVMLADIINKAQNRVREIMDSVPFTDEQQVEIEQFASERGWT